MGTLLREGQRLSYSLMGAKGNPVVESFFARFKAEGGDQFLEAKSLGELRGVVEERLRYYRGVKEAGGRTRASARVRIETAQVSSTVSCRVGLPPSRRHALSSTSRFSR